MATFKYDISQIPVDFTERTSTISDSEKSLIEDYVVGQKFDTAKNRLDLLIYSIDNQLLESNIGYTKYSALLNSAAAGQDGSFNITIDPQKDMVDLGYETGDVRLLYKFTNNLFADSIFGDSLFIESISPDRTEFRALSLTISEEDIQKFADNVVTKLNDPSYFSEFEINFGNNITSVGLNITTEQTDNGLAVVVKVYEALPDSIQVNSTFTIEETISDPVAYEVITTFIDDVISIPKLKGPNFNVSAADDSTNNTQYLDYNELFSYPVTSSNYQLHSLLSEKGAEIATKYNSFDEFVHFSSAEERVRNFQYKLSLLEAYENNLDVYQSSSLSDNQATGSREYYKNLISGVINNFDHYDKFLYFGSGSHSWPKTSGSLYATSHISASNWFNDKLTSASAYDSTNYDILINTIPTFIREDSNNENYLMFIHMVAQHFDNIWIYMKAMSDRYDTDHRLDYGISKDIVRSAIESFGVNLYNSNQNLDNIFSMLIGEAVNTGSENISNIKVATSASFNSGSTALEHLQPVAKLGYEQEVYKRLYHNLPHLTKTKGTERGLRALINCFGIPFNMLSITQFGGTTIDSDRFFGPHTFQSSSISQSTDTSITTSYEPSGSIRYNFVPNNKIRIDNTGSIASGSTLSKYTSVVKDKKIYTDDSHQLQIGFNLSRGTNEYIDNTLSGSFNIDNYIGDPRLSSTPNYEELNKLGRTTVAQSYSWNEILSLWEEADWSWDTRLAYSRSPKALIRLLNFFDSSLFRIIKDFVPARTKVDTGIIIESHKLARSKAKTPSVSSEDVTKSGSLSIASITGSQGGVYDLSASYGFTTNYSASIVTPLGRAPRNVTDESPMFTGEFSGSLLVSTDGEVGKGNPFINLAQPNITFDLTLFNLSLPLPPACIIVLSASFDGEYYEAYATGTVGDAVSGSIQKTYPTVGSSTLGSMTFTHDFDTYEFFTLTATEGYLADFKGWYTQFPTGSVANRITTESTLSVYYESEATYGNKYFAVFDP